jgi:hypothetical protein
LKPKPYRSYESQEYMNKHGIIWRRSVRSNRVAILLLRRFSIYKGKY